MKLMEKYLGEHPEEKKILDVGCGSGILSICGALLGSREILGIEIDEDAVRVAHENVEENHVEDAVKVMQGDLTKGVDFKADVIVANLMADLVMLLSEDGQKAPDGGRHIHFFRYSGRKRGNGIGGDPRGRLSYRRDCRGR